MSHTFHVRLFCCAMAVGVVLPAQAQTRASAAARKPLAETPLGTCAAANKQALVDLGQAIDAAVRRSVASPVVVTRLQGAKAQVAKLRDGLPTTQRTLPDCEAAASTIAAEKERLVRMAGADPEATDCVAANQKIHAALVLGLATAQRAGLPADEAAALQASGVRLHTLGAALAHGNLLLTDCRRLGAQLAQERVPIERWVSAGSAIVPMPTTSLPPSPTVQTVQAGQGSTQTSAPDAADAADAPDAPDAAVAAVVPSASSAPDAGRASPAPVAPVVPVAPDVALPALAPAPTFPAPAALPATPEACREAQATQYNQAAQMFATVAQSSVMSPDKVMLFQALSGRLTRLRGLIADRNAPGWDCAGVLQGLQQVRAELQPLTAAPLAAPLATPPSAAPTPATAASPRRR